MDAIDASATLVRLYRLDSGPLRRARARADHHRLAPTRCAWRSTALEQHKGVVDARRSRSTGSRTKPTAAPAGGQPAVRRRARSARRDEVERDARLPRGRDRSLRRRRQRARRRHGQARIARRCCLIVVAPHPGRADLRLHQRLPRRRQFDRDGRVDARAVARARRSSGRRSSTSSRRSPSAPRSPRPSAPG